MQGKSYLPQLDTLRFLAFFSVFIAHAPKMDWIPGYARLQIYGPIGVDLFLCISAFLFVHLLRTEWDTTGTIRVGYFYLRRGLRIWPLYFFYVGLLALVLLRTDGPYSGQLPGIALGTLTFTYNALTVFGVAAVNTYTYHLWTISYEEQFYAVIPWFLRFAFSHQRKAQILALALAFVVGTGLRALLLTLSMENTPDIIYSLPVTHFEAILLGTAIGLGLFDGVFRRIPSWLTLAAGLLGLWGCTFLPDFDINDWHLMVLYPAAGFSVSLVLYSALRISGRKASAWLQWRPLVYLGKISYGLYIYHLMIRRWTSTWTESFFSHKSVQNKAYFEFGVALFLTMVIAAISYQVLEKPFLRLKSRFTIVPSRPI